MSSEDRAALVALFRSTGGTRWERNKNWDTDAELSQWSGVKVNDDGRVVKLDLFLNSLRGTIPVALGALTELKELELYDNELMGPIPEALGALTKLAHLSLHNNKLTGAIPEALGALKELKKLQLYNNKLTGPIPEALGALKELTALSLGWNKLAGSIPAWLGSLRKLKSLVLANNQLIGPIPGALGALKELALLWLNDNMLNGSIPTSLGSLIKLEYLWLQSNQLVGHFPKELGNLEKLKELRVQNNRLTGAIPTELGNLSALSKFEFGGNAAPKTIWRHRRKQLTGGPAEGERLDSWRARMALEQRTKQQALKGDRKQEDATVRPTSPPPVLLPQQQQTGEGDNKDEGDAPVPLGAPNQREEAVGERVRSPERASLSAGKAEEVDRLFRAELSSSAGLDSLIRVNPAALEDIQRVIEAPVAGSFDFDDQLSDMERRRKLGTLVTMSNALGEVALRHTEDMNVQRKELALPAFSKEYYAAIRTGLCQAYLAASVVDSDWVSTSKTGGMGKAGAALKLMSSAVPVIGGLTGLAGKALETGDHCLQTRRLVKITAMAADAVECCSLARRLALQLTDGLRNDAGATANDTDQVRVHTTAGMKGGSGYGRGADMLPDIMSEEDVFEYVLEEVSSYESNDHGGRRLGKQHLRKLLKAVQRGCLDGANCTEQKIEVLLLEILPEADNRPAATSSTPKEVIVRSPSVAAAAHDSALPSMADFAAMQAALEALKCDRETQQAELEELQAAKEMQEQELKAMGSANEKLQRKMSAMEKRVPEGDSEPCDRVNAGGGQVLQKKLEMKEDLETFWQRKENAASARDERILTPAEHQAETRDTQARVDDVDDRVDFMEARLAALEQQQAGKKKGF